MIVLDTSSLIRFFTNDIPTKATKVKKVMESKKNIFIPDVCFPELEYVLMGKTYNSNRGNILKAFQYLATKKNIKISKEVVKAIGIYEKSKLDIADCIIAATAHKKELLSFNKQLISVVKSEK